MKNALNKKTEFPFPSPPDRPGPMHDLLRSSGEALKATIDKAKDI